MNTETETIYCPACCADTEHVEKWRREPSRSHEAPRPARLVRLCVTCGLETGVLGSRAGVGK